MAFDSWESYFYPPPDDRTLRNLLDERDPGVLHDREYGRAAFRQRQLESGQVPVDRTFDGEHLRAIHRHLFQDVYEWAGQYRTVNMAKGIGRGFGDVHAGEVDRLLADAHRVVAGTAWDRLDRQAFGEQAARVFAYVNQAHPFREGNGRTSKVFMAHVAEQSRFALDFSRVTPEVWNQASQMSRPDLSSYEPYPEFLTPVFQELAVPRSALVADDVEPGVQAPSLVRASYPQAAQDATRPGAAPATAPRTPGVYRPGRSAEPGRGE